MGDALDFETEQKRIEHFVSIGNYHAAINIAISGLNACRREQDQAGVRYYLDLIKAIVASMEEAFDEGAGSDK